MSEHLTKLKMIVKLNGWEEDYKEILTLQLSCKIAIQNNRFLYSQPLLEIHELVCRHCASFRVFEYKASKCSVVSGALTFLTDLQEYQ